MSEPIVFWMPSQLSDGWVVEQRGDRFAVSYKTNEVMRLGADGTLSFGQPEPYWFQTREWAELCVRSMQRLDLAFERSGPFIAPNGSLITTASLASVNAFEFRLGSKAIASLGQNGELTRLDLPALIGIWWRGTSVYASLQKLLWGERGRA